MISVSKQKKLLFEDQSKNFKLKNKFLINIIQKLI